MKLDDLATAQNIIFNQETKDEIFGLTRNAAASIIERKGATNYAIAAGLRCIVAAILRDQNTVLCVSNLMEETERISDV